MIPKRVFFWSDQQTVSDEQRDLLALYRDEIEEEIRNGGTDDAETIPLGNGEVGFLTNLPKPMIGRVMARWVLLNDEEALVTGVRTGEAYETPEGN